MYPSDWQCIAKGGVHNTLAFSLGYLACFLKERAEGFLTAPTKEAIEFNPIDPDDGFLILWVRYKAVSPASTWGVGVLVGSVGLGGVCHHRVAWAGRGIACLG